MVDFLIANPLVLLFTIAAIGYPLGMIKIGGSSLGIAAVLFVGLAFGALDPNIKLPEIVYQLGLVLFVYTIGLSSGRGFFRAMRRRGLIDNALIAGMLVLAAALTYAAARLVGLQAGQAAGLYAGSLTNTPALAAVIEALKTSPPATGVSELLLSQPVVGYSIAYPGGVIGMIVVIAVMRKWLKPDETAENQQLRKLGLAPEEIVNQTLCVTNAAVIGKSIATLVSTHDWRVVFARRVPQSAGATAIELVNGETRLSQNDRLSVIGTRPDIDLVAQSVGGVIADDLTRDRGKLDFHHVFVSSPQVLGRKIGDLALQRRFGALVTRVLRGDIELLATADTVLEPGDRVRIVTLRERMRDVTEFFGDSYRALSEIDILTFSLGLVLGLLLGQIPVVLPGGAVLKLGIAGGPLLMALVLGALERSGPLIWTIPYSANLTLRQIGLVLFLSAIGTRAGFAFINTLLSAGGLTLMLLGAFVTVVTAFLTLLIGYKVFRIPMSLLTGMLAGLQTNPAILSFAVQQARNDVPNIGYATVYPIAMIGKIIVAQALLLVMNGEPMN